MTLTEPLIIIIDDSAASNQIISVILQDAGYRILSTADAADGISMAESERPDLMLLGITIDGYSGFDLCGKFKLMPGLRETPVIFLADSMKGDDIINAYESGGVDYILSPVRAEELLARVKTHIEFFSTKKILKLQEERLSFALEGSGDGIWDWDASTNRVFFSLRWKEMLGYNEDEVGDSLNEWERRVHPDDMDSVLADLNRHLSGETEIYQNEHRVLCRDGSYLWILDRGKVISRDSDGKPLRIIGTHSDISGRKLSEQKLKEAEIRYRTLFESSPDGIVVIDPDSGLPIEFNERAHLILGYSAEEFAVLRINDYEAVEHPEETKTRIRRVMKTGRDDFETVHIAKNGILLDIMVTIMLIELNGKQVINAIFRDISARKKYERALIQSRDEADRANRAKSEFLANMSHEIRTPISAVIGFARILKDKLSGSEEAGLAEGILKGTRGLLTLINDILDLSKIEAGAMTIIEEPCDIRRLVNDISDVFSIQLKEKNFEFHTEVHETVPRFLFIDETRIRQILFNLTGNALKFTDEGQVSLKVFPLSFEDIGGSNELTLVLEVRDTGIGIAADQIENIFNPFVQADGQSTRKYGGTGLGLAITRRLVSMMKGTVSVKSDAGSGSVFRVEIPSVKPVSGIESIPSETHHEDGDSVDPFLEKNVEKIKDTLKNEHFQTLIHGLMPEWERAAELMSNDEIASFADSLYRFSVFHKIDDLAEFAMLMKKYTSGFDVINMRAYFSKFRELSS